MKKPDELEDILKKIDDPTTRHLVDARIKELENQVETYKKQSRTDYLTGTLNNRGFDEVLERAISRANRYSIGFSFGFVDLYDLRGHNKVDYSEGNKAIIKLSEILLENARKDDSVARTGGDEFSLLITGLSESSHEQYLDRMNKRILNEPRIVPQIPFMAYWGLSEYYGQSKEELIFKATQKLNEDKIRIKKMLSQ